MIFVKEIQDTGITIKKSIDILNKKLNYEILKKEYIIHKEKMFNRNNVFVEYVDKGFNIRPLLEDLNYVYNFKREMLLVLDGNNYSNEHTISSLIGTSKGYIGYQEGGILTEHILKYPIQLIHFKNVTDSSYLKSFIKNLTEKSFLIDYKGRKINLQNTMFLVELDNCGSLVGFLSSNNSKYNRLVSLQVENKEYSKVIKKYAIEMPENGPSINQEDYIFQEAIKKIKTSK